MDFKDLIIRFLFLLIIILYIISNISIWAYNRPQKLMGEDFIITQKYKN